MRQTKEYIIIKAAIDVLSKENYHTMRTADIAARAGVAEGTLYRYFSSKKELFVGVLKFVTNSLEQTFIKGIREDASWKENIRILGQNFYFHHKETRNYYRIMYKAFSEIEDDAIRTELGRVFSSGIEMITQIFLWDPRFDSQRDGERLRVAAMMLWGVGDILWKKQELQDESVQVQGRELELILQQMEYILAQA